MGTVVPSILNILEISDLGLIKPNNTSKIIVKALTVRI